MTADSCSCFHVLLHRQQTFYFQIKNKHRTSNAGIQQRTRCQLLTHSRSTAVYIKENM